MSNMFKHCKSSKAKKRVFKDNGLCMTHYKKGDNEARPISTMALPLEEPIQKIRNEAKRLLPS